MDTAQKLLKTSAILLAIALLMAAPGWAQPTLLAPATVTIGNTGSNSASVTSSAAGTTEITYTIGAPNYSGDTTGAPTGWLIVSGGTTTPSNLNFSVRTASGLSQGSSATVTLTPTAPAGVAAVTITVVFNGSGGGGGSSTLSASPSPLYLSTGANSTTAPAAVSISTTGSSALTITAVSTTLDTGTSVSWLSASIANAGVSPGSPGSINVTATSTGGLPSGTYTGSVTVTPSSGASLNISVNFSVGGGGGTGNWSVSPSSIAWNFTTGSGNFPNQTVSVTPPSLAAYYNVSTTSSNGWLLASVNGSDGTGTTGIALGTPTTLKVGSQGNALTQGQISGTAVFTDSNGNQFTLYVTLTVNGGNSAGLTVSPNPASFSAALNSAQQSLVVTLNSNVGGPVTVTGIGTTPAWLSATGPSPATLVAGQAATFTVYASPSGLIAGTYSASIAVSVGSQSGTLTVNLVVGGGGSGGTGTTAVAPTSLNFAYQFGTNLAFVARQKLVITGPAGAWSSVISNGSTWLRLSPGGGSALPNPASDGDTPIVSIDPTDLTVGSYAGTISITTAGGIQTVQVSLNVVSGAVLLPTPGALIFNAQTGQANPAGQALFFSISDSTLLPSLSISAVSNNPWIVLSGPTPSSVTVRVDQTGLGTGTYSGSIAVSQTGVANSTSTIPILLVVNGGGGGTFGTLTFSQNPIGFTSVNGSTPNSTTLSVGANASTSFVGSITYTNGSGWLNVSPLSSTTPANLSVSVNPAGLAASTYNATISFNANGVIQTVGVTLTVTTSSTTGNVTVSVTSLTFTSLSGSSPAGQSITVNSASGAAGVPFTVQVTAGSSWLSTTAISNPTTSYSFTVNVNSNVLQAGPYTGNILITPNGGTAVNVPVNLTIAAPAAVSATPTTLTFDYRAGDSAPSPKQLTVSGGGATLTYAVTPSSTGNWLVVSPAAGTTPGTVNVSIDPTGLSTGVYNGSVLVAGAGGAPGSTNVTVTLNVTVPLPTITKVTNAASYATGLISPGEIITLFAGDPTHPIGPATAAGLALDATGKVSTTIGGVQVTVNGYFCPMIYASASQVSAVVPYEVKGFVTATVLVKFLGQSSNGVLVNVATTVPGVFTSNSSGTGPGAILNSNSTPNSAANPATRGDTVVVYFTGEGETSPAGVTGKVTTVAAPPQPLTPGPLLQPSVTIGGQPAQWSFAGEAPTFVSGVMQLNVVVPTNIAAGDQFIVVSIGGNPSQPGVTVSLR